MGKLRICGLWPSGRNARRLGLGLMCWSVALAAVCRESWMVSFLVGAFLFGLGAGLGDWEMKGGES